MLGRDSEDEIWSRFVFELVIWHKQATLLSWIQPSGPLCLWQCSCKPERALSWNLIPLNRCLIGGRSIRLVVIFHWGWGTFEESESEVLASIVIGCRKWKYLVSFEESGIILHSLPYEQSESRNPICQWKGEYECSLVCIAESRYLWVRHAHTPKRLVQSQIFVWSCIPTRYI